MASSRNFKFGAKDLAQLVNNDYMADVVFKVGTSGEMIYAHKVIITMASEVFFAQFGSGNFAESAAAEEGDNLLKKPVVIDDIDPVTFLDIMNYIYCRKKTLVLPNVLDVYYAAQKYLLKDLITSCETFFANKIDDSNVLNIFNKNHPYKFDLVDQKCLAIISDNPLKFFAQGEFLELNQRAVELIASLRTMNCDMEDLMGVIEQWKKATGTTEFKIAPKLEGFQCYKLASYSSFRYTADILTDLKLTVEDNFALYGVGIFVGVKGLLFPCTTVKITCTIMGTSLGTSSIAVSKTVPLSNHLSTCEILFPKVEIANTGQITVSFESEDLVCLEFFCLDSFKPVSVLDDVNLKVVDMFPNNRSSSYGTNCVAYLLYDV